MPIQLNSHDESIRFAGNCGSCIIQPSGMRLTESSSITRQVFVKGHKQNNNKTKPSERTKTFHTQKGHNFVDAFKDQICEAMDDNECYGTNTSNSWRRASQLSLHSLLLLYEHSSSLHVTNPLELLGIHETYPNSEPIAPATAPGLCFVHLFIQQMEQKKLERKSNNGNNLIPI